MMEDMALAQKVKSFAKKEGASLVGRAPVSRWEKAPIQHSPQGVMPGAKSVIVCALHIPDASVELGAEEDPWTPGAGLAQDNVTRTLNYLAFRIASFIEEAGWKSVPVSATTMWNYRPQPGAERGWAADISHFYAAACAGLGEIGWHNLCITPEFGARQRFISIITDAVLEPDPMYSGPPLCDKCMLCAKNCPMESFDKEVCGECSIEIEDKKYTFPNRNLWRCSLGENFLLDVKKEWPDKIDEEFVIRTEEIAAKEHPEWIYGWKMGMCLKWCVNPQRRFFDRKYCKSPRRKKDIVAETTPQAVNNITNELTNLAYEKGADLLVTASREYLLEKGLDIKKELPDAAGAILVGCIHPEWEFLNPGFRAKYVELLIAYLLEKHGHSAMLWPNIEPDEAATLFDCSREEGKQKVFRIILTSLPVKTVTCTSETEPVTTLSAPALTSRVRKMLYSEGADLVGIAPAQRVEELTNGINKLYEDRKDYFMVHDMPPIDLKRKNIWGTQGMPFNPQPEEMQLRIKKPSEYLEGAKSVIVAGIKLPDGIVDSAGKGEGKKAGFYDWMIHRQAQWVLSGMLLKASKFLERSGYRVVPVFNNTESHYLTANRIAAVAAGLGEIGWNGMVLTPQYGPRQYFIALVTDAPLDSDSLYKGDPLCKKCYNCVEACPANAIQKEPLSVSVEGTEFSWADIDQLRCDWACRYGLLGEAGPKYFHSKTDFPVPDKITSEAVCRAINEADRLQKPQYTAIVERCFTECPAGKQES